MELLEEFQPAGIYHTLRLKNDAVVILRRVRPDDGERMQALMRGLSMQSRYQRFFYSVHELTPDMLARFRQADPARAITLLAVVWENGEETAVGMAQYVADPYPEHAEFAVVVADAWQRTGIATGLMRKLGRIARAAGIARMEGDVLSDNASIRRLLLSMDFRIGPHPHDAHLRKAWKELRIPLCRSAFPDSMPCASDTGRHAWSRPVSRPAACCI